MIYILGDETQMGHNASREPKCVNASRGNRVSSAASRWAIPLPKGMGGGMGRFCFFSFSLFFSTIYPAVPDSDSTPYRK